jgi:hypothetical protein
LLRPQHDVKTKIEKTGGNAVVKAVAKELKMFNKKQAKTEEEPAVVMVYVPSSAGNCHTWCCYCQN